MEQLTGKTSDELAAELQGVIFRLPGPVPEGERPTYNKWLGDQAKPSHRELLRVAIDKALAQKPADLDELLKLLRESGCEVSGRGKSYRLKLPGWSKVARLDSLGDGYTLEDLLAVLAGQKEHTPRQKPVKQADPSKVNLLVDIQAKLQAGKGAGYVRWAKVFNLKQMAQTVNYLTEHNLLEYAVLEEKAAAATAHHNELSSKIKAAEKRIAVPCSRYSQGNLGRYITRRTPFCYYSFILLHSTVHLSFQICLHSSYY